MSDMRDEKTDQALPTRNTKSMPVGEYLKSLIDKRTELGVKKYGTPLMTHNGRSAERDALEESIDLNQYLCQLLMEERDRPKGLPTTEDGHVMIPGVNVWICSPSMSKRFPSDPGVFTTIQGIYSDAIRCGGVLYNLKDIRVFVDREKACVAMKETVS